jgi:hypothetical protein
MAVIILDPLIPPRLSWGMGFTLGKWSYRLLTFIPNMETMGLGVSIIKRFCNMGVCFLCP